MTENNLEEKFKVTLDTIKSYPKQLRQAWDETNMIDIPEDYAGITNTVLCGMGGSALGTRLVNSALQERLRVPAEIVNGYRLPYYANDKTFLIVSSYSGTTEETITNLEEAINKNTKIFGITTGNRLGKILTDHKIPAYIFDPKFNASLQPRMSLGYSVGSMLSLYSKLNIADISEEEIGKAIKVMENVIAENDDQVEENNNLAKKYAINLKNRIPILTASEHLIGAAHAIKNQFNESAKTFAVLFDIPELNHHLMEGLKNPAKLHEFFTFFFINSKLYSERVQKRYPITADVVDKNGVEHLMYYPASETKLSQAMEVLTFGSFVVYYITKNLNIDPTVIPWVDYFKKELAK